MKAARDAKVVGKNQRITTLHKKTITRSVSHRTRQYGLTLVELLVAIGLSILLGTLAVKVLHSTVTAKSQVISAQEALSQLSQMTQFLEIDLLGLQPNTFSNDAFGQKLPAVVADSETLLSFTRLGWAQSVLDDTPRSNFQQVTWSLFEQSSDVCRHTNRAPLLDNKDQDRLYCLVRAYDVQLDSLNDNAVRQVDLVGQIRNASVQFLVKDASGSIEKQAQWIDKTEGNSKRVVGVEFLLNHDRFGELTWIFPIPEGWS